MPQVEFDEYQTQSNRDFDTTPKMIRWTIEYSGGLVKDEEKAQHVLFGFVVFAVLVSLFLVFKEGEVKNYNVERPPLNMIEKYEK